MPRESSDIQLASEMMAANYATVAFVMTLLYDYTLTFGEEVEYVWQQRISLGKTSSAFRGFMSTAGLVESVFSPSAR